MPWLTSPTIVCARCHGPAAAAIAHLTRSLQVEVPVYLLHSTGDQLCEVSASKHFESLHANNLSKFVYPDQGKHELLQETELWKVRPTPRVFTDDAFAIGSHVSNALSRMNHGHCTPRQYLIAAAGPSFWSH
jgi:hypothetical protein